MQTGVDFDATLERSLAPTQKQSLRASIHRIRSSAISRHTR